MYSKNKSAAVRTLKYTNRVLLMVVIAIGIIGIYGLFSRSASVDFFPRERDTLVELPLQETSDNLELDQYLAIVNKKQLFKKSVRRAVDRASRGAHRKTIQELAAPVVLIGIVGGEEPVAILKNARSNKTYSLKQGEYLDDLLVQEIKANSVILTYESESLELKL